MDVLAATAQGAPNVARLSVVRAESQGVKELDDIHVEMHLAQAQQLVYGRDKPEVTAIALQLNSTNDVAAAHARLNELLGGSLRSHDLEVHDFMTLSPAYGQTIALYGAIFGFISALISAIVLFMISNTMSMAVLERTVEIGTLRAMGLRRSGVVRLFLGEAMLLSIIAVGIGILAALAIAQGINNSGITWTPPGRVDAIPLTVRAWGETGLMIRTALLLIVVALVSALLPSRRAASTNIVDALRHV
jgi:putative ABC transport system permease protein